MSNDSPVLTEGRSASARDYLGVSLFWLATSFLWGALLTYALPEHIRLLFGDKGKDAALSVLLATGAGIAGVSQVVFGALSDESTSRWGRRRPFLFAGILLAVIPMFLLPQARTLMGLVVAYGLLQLFINVASGPYQALMHDLVPPDDQGTASAYIGVAGIVGRIGGPLVAVIVMGLGLSSLNSPVLKAARSQSNFALLLAIFAGVLVAVMLITLGLLRERPLAKNQAKKVSLGARLRSTFSVPLRPYPDFVWLVVSRFGITMGIYTVSFCLLYYIRDTLGYKNPDDASFIIRNFLVLSTLTGLVGTFPSGALAKRLGRKKVLFGANIICMAAGLCFALANNLPLAYIAAGIFGAGFGAFSAVDWALATSLLPPNEPAKYMGVWGLSDTMSQVAAPVIAGPLALLLNRSLGSGMGYRALMILALGWFLLGTLALKPIRERTIVEGGM